MIRIKKLLNIDESNVDLKIGDVIKLTFRDDGNYITAENEYLSVKVLLNEAFYNSFIGHLSDGIGSYEETILCKIISLELRRYKQRLILKSKELSERYAIQSVHVRRRLEDQIERIDDELKKLYDYSILCVDYLVDAFYFSQSLTVVGFSPLMILTNDTKEASFMPTSRLLQLGGLSSMGKGIREQVDVINKKMSGFLVSRLDLMDKAVRVDRECLEFLVNNRYNLLTITDTLCNMNIFKDELDFNEITDRGLIFKSKLSKLMNAHSDVLQNKKLLSSTIIRSFSDLYSQIYGQRPVCNIMVDEEFSVSSNALGVPSVVTLSEFLVLIHASKSYRKRDSILILECLSNSIEVDLTDHPYMNYNDIDVVIRELRRFVDISKIVTAILSDSIEIRDSDIFIDVKKFIQYVKGVVW